MIRRWTIWLPLYHPPTVNAYSRDKHVRYSAGHKLDKLLLPWTWPHSPDRVPPAEIPRLVVLTLVMAPGDRRPDRDSSYKVILDGLKRGGLLKDDSPDWCDVAPLRYERAAHPAKAGTRVELVELTDCPGPPLVGGGSVQVRAEGADVVAVGHYQFRPDDVPVLCHLLSRAADRARSVK